MRMNCVDPHLIRVLSQNGWTYGPGEKKNARFRTSSGGHFFLFSDDLRSSHFDQQVTAGGFEPPTLRAEI